MRFQTAIAGAALALAISTTGATAHQKHQTCERGPGGWHYHLEKRLICRARPTSRYWAWRKRPDGSWGWWHRRQSWWLTPLSLGQIKRPAPQPKAAQ